jgi:hypothetical protein
MCLIRHSILATGSNGSTVLYCTVLYCTALHCSHCSTEHAAMLHATAPVWQTVPHSSLCSTEHATRWSSPLNNEQERSMPLPLCGRLYRASYLRLQLLSRFPMGRSESWECIGPGANYSISIASPYCVVCKSGISVRSGEAAQGCRSSTLKHSK